MRVEGGGHLVVLVVSVVDALDVGEERYLEEESMRINRSMCVGGERSLQEESMSMNRSKCLGEERYLQQDLGVEVLHQQALQVSTHTHTRTHAHTHTRTIGGGLEG